MALCLAAAVGAAVPAAQDATRPTEDQVKAAFLLNFARFVEWPAGAFSPGEPLAICVVGPDPFHGELEALTRGERIGGREIAIRRPAGVTGLGDCHVLFVTRSERWRAGRMLASVSGAPVLTVSDLDEFTRLGGMIQLANEQQRIVFAINPGAAERAGLRISSRLLSLARIVSERDR